MPYKLKKDKGEGKQCTATSADISAFRLMTWPTPWHLIFYPITHSRYGTTSQCSPACPYHESPVSAVFIMNELSLAYRFRQVDPSPEFAEFLGDTQAAVCLQITMYM